MACLTIRHRSHEHPAGSRLSRLARLVLLGGACVLAGCGLAQANTQAFGPNSQSRPQTQTDTPAQAQPQRLVSNSPVSNSPVSNALASTWSRTKLLNVQAQIVPLSDNSLANASAGFLPTPLAIARPQGQGGVVLWDEIRIQPPVASTANGVVTITINGK